MAKTTDSSGNGSSGPKVATISLAADPTLFPQWVTPHASHVLTTKGGQVVAPLWTNINVNRVTGAVTVLVNNPQEKALALAATTLTES